MAYPLRHSHIAIMRPLAALAHVADAEIGSGEDDLGPYRYFDITAGAGTDFSQIVRFASHEGDSMVHLLAERIEDVGQIAEALWAIGLGRSRVPEQSYLSISRDREGRPVRDVREIWHRLMDVRRRTLLQRARIRLTADRRLEASGEDLSPKIGVGTVRKR